MKKKPQVAVVMGSSSDLPVMEEVGKTLEEFNVEYKMFILSAHRSPGETVRFSRTASAKGFKIIITGAGKAAHLPGVIASETILPVIGVPLVSAPLKGLDAFVSMWQMPGGVPVSVMSIGKSGAINAALTAVRILALDSKKIQMKLKAFKKILAQKVKESNKQLP